MSLSIVAQAEVIEKTTRDYRKDDGTTTTYYNIKLGDRKLCESQTVSVSQELFNAVKEGETVKLKGLVGGVGNQKWFTFKELIK